jgi:hypothetical protein
MHGASREIREHPNGQEEFRLSPIVDSLDEHGR